MDIAPVEPNSTKPLDYNSAYFNIPNTPHHPLLSLTVSLEHGCIGFPETKQIPPHALNYACSLEETRQLLQQQIPDLPPHAFDAWTLPATLYPSLFWPQPLQPTRLTLCYEFSTTTDSPTFEQDPTESAPETRYYSYPVENPDCTQALAFGFYGLRNNVILASVLPLLMPAATAWSHHKENIKCCSTYHPVLLLLNFNKLSLLPHSSQSTPVAQQLLQNTLTASLPPTLSAPPTQPSTPALSMEEVQHNISSKLCQQELLLLSC